MNGAIELITGTLGGGKTLVAVERIYEHLERGGYVFTNIELYPEEITRRMAERGYVFDPSRLTFLKPEDMEKFHEHVARGTKNSQVMVAIDEAHLSHHARDYLNTDTSLVDFNTLVRKLDILLLYITQDPSNLDKQFRKMVGTLWVCRNMRHYKILGVLPFPIPIFFRVQFDTTRGQKPVKVSSDISYRKSWACGMYNSDALLGSTAQRIGQLRQVEAKPLARIPLKQRPKSLEPSYALEFWASGFPPIKRTRVERELWLVS
jgi:hypothetical protein